MTVLSPLPRLASVAALSLLAACKSVRTPLLVDAKTNDNQEFPEAQVPPPPSTAPVPAEPVLDWIRLKSGEWLRGTLLHIRDGALDFDSKILDELTISLDDIAAIRTATPQAVVTTDDKSLVGKMVLEGKDLWIDGDRTIAIDRDRMFAALALNEGRAVDWSGEVTLGVTARSGNTQQNDTNGYVELVRNSARTVWKTTYSGVASSAGGSETANNHRVRSINNVFLTRSLFVTAPMLDIYRDRFQNIDYRIIPAATIGYEIIDTDDQSWKLSTGPAYRYTRFEDTAPGGDVDTGEAGAVILSQYGWDVTDDVEVGLEYQINAALDDLADYNHNLQARMSVDLVGDLTFDVVFVWDRVNQPAEDENGVTPLKDDYRTTIGLGWEF